MKNANEAAKKKTYQSQYPTGTPIEVKSRRVLELIQNAWSKKPIPLNIINPDGTVRQIEAQFDPTYDHKADTDAGKLMSRPHYGSATTRKVALDIADSWYEIIENSKYHSSAPERGKTGKAHDGVKEWHYFVNDILFQNAEGDEPRPYRIQINVKEKEDGYFVYSIAASKTKEAGVSVANVSTDTPA